ncbi:MULTISPECIES: HIT family protein [Dietzia]|uniref:HIT family protein n=1 Tax=Dietzia cinnamea TaxID=321318 RepID=A0AAW5Q781_9ACTN|nr:MULTISPECIES: HIT family protein [Dietzia]PWD96467.1 HIT family protein [Dietzia maris]MBM7229735.1 HIT family protein [Dietzia cinnamea]MCT1638766.1 HIT family protein [Dietzia cinnamea]MCT1863194.1 HIT family protein [Dietzia cinnamea]MCT2029671.1 HIT family protein [Dietzia cinnamea]
MSTVFSKIIAGELPGRFVWKDPDVVAFLTIAPVAPGHTLVVPRAEVDRWTDLEPELLARLNEVAQAVGKAVLSGFGAKRAGYLIAGFEVPHTHIHVFPANDMSGFDLSLANPDAPAEESDAAAETLRRELRELGYGEFVPEA